MLGIYPVYLYHVAQGWAAVESCGVLLVIADPLFRCLSFVGLLVRLEFQQNTCAYEHLKGFEEDVLTYVHGVAGWETSKLRARLPRGMIAFEVTQWTFLTSPRPFLNRHTHALLQYRINFAIPPNNSHQVQICGGVYGPKIQTILLGWFRTSQRCHHVILAGRCWLGYKTTLLVSPPFPSPLSLDAPQTPPRQRR
jgi:hypothetical protein